MAAKKQMLRMMCFITHVHILFNMKLYIAFKSKTKLFALGVEKTFANNADVSNKNFSNRFKSSFKFFICSTLKILEFRHVMVQTI